MATTYGGHSETRGNSRGVSKERHFVDIKDCLKKKGAKTSKETRNLTENEAH